MRLVVDTNLMIRALLSAGPARQFFKLAPLQHQILYHSEQFAELRDVAARSPLKIAPETVTELVERIERYGRRIDCDLNIKLDCRDPKDDYVLALASAGKAETILTEDDDLLVLDPWRGVRILRLFQFLKDHPLHEKSARAKALFLLHRHRSLHPRMV